MPDLLMIVLSFCTISFGYAFLNEARASEATPATDETKKDPTTKIEPTKVPLELIKDEPDITKPDESTEVSEGQVADVSDLTKAKETMPKATPTETEPEKTTLSERVQIFIPSEDIDTEKAVAFPTNI
ncbi:MAG: hypothetical protein ACJAVI_000051 [Candidatus Azotimanducaceae bacterium]|jgi:hypothetical protein